MTGAGSKGPRPFPEFLSVGLSPPLPAVWWWGCAHSLSRAPSSPILRAWPASRSRVVNPCRTSSISSVSLIPIIQASFPIQPRLLVPTIQQREVKKLGIQDKTEPREVTASVAADLRVFAGQKWPTMNHKWRKARLASLLGMTERRVKSLYEADEAARLRVDEEARIKALLGQKEEENDAHAEADRALAERVAELEAQLAFVVAALAGEQMEAGGVAGIPQGRNLHSEDRRIADRRSADRTD